jgi:uncharacterized protein (TIGR00730 family)
MSKIKAICVYCGSSPGTDPAFTATARGFGKILAENGVRLVYGGGSIGLMGALAGAVIEHGGAATGIIPEFLTAKERPRRLAQEQIVTRDMHERKRTMFERADAFVALPGGLGTLEELVEQMTWAQLGRHKKPILIANINGFWNPLLALIDAHARAGPRALAGARRRAPRRRPHRGHPAEAARGGGRGHRSGEANGRAGGAAVDLPSP